MLRRLKPFTKYSQHFQHSLISTTRSHRIVRLSRKHFTGIPQRYIPFETLEKLHSGPSLEDFLSESENKEDLLSRDPNKAGRTENSRTNAVSNLQGKNLGQKYTRNPKSKNRKPSWLKMEEVAKGEDYERTRETVRKLGLATVCEEAQCPNIGACWGGGKDQIATATIMLMGDTCTRGCRFCSVKTSKSPPKLDETEPYRVGKAILDWGLKYVVLTSVDRDDYQDGGANHIATTVEVIKNSKVSPYVEVLCPDFQGNELSIDRVISSGLDVFAHNIEAVRRLSPVVRDRRADYDQSLSVLKYAKNRFNESKEKNENKNEILLTKSSIMLGFGETQDEVLQTLKDLKEIGNCDVVTLGQYLQPTRGHLKVTEYVPPEQFDFYKQEAEKMGFLYVASGPLVRSSYKAGEYFVENYLNKQKAANDSTANDSTTSDSNV